LTYSSFTDRIQFSTQCAELGEIMDLIKDEISDKIVEAVRILSKDKNVGKITVRDVLKYLNITNRVFYNRFHNMEEVNEVLYKKSVEKLRQSLSIPWDEEADFGQNILNMVVGTLKMSYESRKNMSEFILEADVTSDSNYEWWNEQIRSLIIKGKSVGYLRDDLDDNYISYSIWCFIRGFNLDAIARNIPLDEAEKAFRYSFGCFLKGLR